MASALKKVATLSAITISALAVVVSAAPAMANRIDTPPTGVTVNQGTPNYDVTIDCDNLPFGGQELFTGPTQHGTYTLHMNSNCQDNSVYLMQVDDNGDTDETGGYTVGGVHNGPSGWIAIPETMTLDPDTYVTVKKLQDNDFFNIRYNGSDVNQVAPVATPLANTGFDSGFYSMLAGSLIALGFGSTIAARAGKRRK